METEGDGLTASDIVFAAGRPTGSSPRRAGLRLHHRWDHIRGAAGRGGDCHAAGRRRSHGDRHRKRHRRRGSAEGGPWGHNGHLQGRSLQHAEQILFLWALYPLDMLVRNSTHQRIRQHRVKEGPAPSPQTCKPSWHHTQVCIRPARPPCWAKLRSEAYLICSKLTCYLAMQQLPFALVAMETCVKHFETTSSYGLASLLHTLKWGWVANTTRGISKPLSLWSVLDIRHWGGSHSGRFRHAYTKCSVIITTVVLL